MNKKIGAICFIATLLVSSIVAALLSLPNAIAMNETDSSIKTICIVFLLGSAALSLYLMMKKEG